MIEASFAQQYGIRLRREDDMVWDEFVTLLCGINGDTPLGRVVSIRSEKDPKVIKGFSTSEKKIRHDWIQKHRKVDTSRENIDRAMNNFASMLKALSKGGT